MKFKVGDRVKLRGTQHKGTVRSVNIPGYYVLLDKGTSAWHKESSLIRLVKKKKPLGVKEYEQIVRLNTESSRAYSIDNGIPIMNIPLGAIYEYRLGGEKAVLVTKKQLADAWDLHVRYASGDSEIFKSLCKGLGFNEGEK